MFYIEFVIIHKYLVKAGFLEFGLTQDDVTLLTYSIFYEWVCFQTITATLRNDGNIKNLLFFPDDSSVGTSFDNWLDFFALSDNIIDFGSVAK